MNIPRAAIAALLLAGCQSTTPTEETRNRQREALASFVDAHVVALTIEAGRARFVTDGRITLAARDVLPNEPFMVAVGEKLKTGPDHHSSIEFIYKGSRGEAVVLAYESRFDHGAFGKDVITIDRGEIEIGLKGGE